MSYSYWKSPFFMGKLTISMVIHGISIPSAVGRTSWKTWRGSWGAWRRTWRPPRWSWLRCLSGTWELHWKKWWENLWKIWNIYGNLWKIWNIYGKSIGSTIGYGICMGYVWVMGNLWDICGIWVVKLNFSTRLEVQVNECNWKLASNKPYKQVGTEGLVCTDCGGFSDKRV